MKYYNHEGKLVTYKETDRNYTIKSGKCSNIYVFDDYVIKKISYLYT